MFSLNKEIISNRKYTIIDILFYILVGFNVFIIIWAVTRQNLSWEVSDQARHKPACAATEAS